MKYLFNLKNIKYILFFIKLFKFSSPSNKLKIKKYYEQIYA